MSYISRNLNFFAGGAVEGTVRRFVYVTTDDSTTYTGADYIDDGYDKGLAAGDIVDVVDVTIPSLTLCQVKAVTLNGPATLQAISGAGSGVDSFNTRTGAVTLTAADIGAVVGVASISHNWLQALGADGSWTLAQPAFSDISGSVTASQLPNPGAATLGGVKSLAAVSHQFLTSIGTNGTPTQAQPAFSDISGTIAAGQLPNPGASSLGGVKSLAAVSHKFLTSIGIDGLPVAAQPAVADLSDSANVGLLNGTNTWSGAQTFGSTLGSVNTQAGTTYTLQASDAGKTLRFTSSSAVTLTTLGTMPAGASIVIIQAGTGQVTIANGSGATQQSKEGFTKTSGQYAVIGLFVDVNSGGSAANYIISGDGA